MSDDKNNGTAAAGGRTGDTPANPDAATEQPQTTPWADAPQDVPETEAGAEAAAPDQRDAADEAAQMKDQLLRTLADMENLRRRTEREIKDASAYAIAAFARDLLGVSDNMRRALQAIPEDALGQGDSALKALHEGVEMTERELLRVLEKHGIRRLDPKDERFDPHFHQAMFEVDDPAVPAGTVAQVVQAGYVIGERVLRPAMVGVSKGGAKQPRAAGEPQQAAQAEAEPLADTGQADRGAAQPQPQAPGDERKGAKVDKSA